MSITKIAIESTVSFEDYVDKIGVALSTYGFTTTYINNSLFYITANITGLDPMYYSIYKSNNDWTIYVRKTAPTSSSTGSNYTNKTYDLRYVNFGSIYTQTTTTNADNTTTNRWYGYVYVLQNSEGDKLINLSNTNFTDVEAPYRWVGITSFVSIYGGSYQAYCLISGTNSYPMSIFTPKNGYEGYFVVTSSSSTNANGFIVNGIMIRKMNFYQSLNGNNVDSNYGWLNSAYLIYTTSLTLSSSKIYVINNIQYLCIGTSLLKIS